MATALPVHPTMRYPVRHSLAGQAVQALYVDKHGRPRYPVMGGAPDDPPNDPPADPPNDPPADPLKDDPDTGFPKDTPVAEMTYQQQAAYHQFHSRKHEQRNKDLRAVIGNKTPDELKTDMDELDQLRAGKRTDAENAVEDAKKTARAEADAEWSTKLVRTALEGRLSHLKPEERDEVIDTVDLAKFLDNGELDSEKLDKFAERHTQPGTGTTRRWPDTGQGRRGDGSKASGVSAGAEMFADSRKNK